MCQGGRPTVSVVSRSAGRSATAAVAYRAAAKVDDLRTGDTHDYTRRGGVEDVLPFIPEVRGLAPGEALPPHLERLLSLEKLWQDAEAAERRSNSRVARELLVPLPHELDRDQRRELVEGIAGDIAARYGVGGTAAIHTPDAKGDQRNFHAHILFTTRRVDMATGQLAEKTRELDDRKTGPQEVEALVAMAERRINGALESAELERRVDFRSLKDRRAEALAEGDEVKAAALDYRPQVHEGPRVTAIRREAEDRRAFEVREGWLDQAEDAPLAEYLLGDCDTIEDNEDAKADRAAALEEAAALWEVLDARAQFEAARIEADRAREAGQLTGKAGELAQLEQPEPPVEPPPTEPAAAAVAAGQDWWPASTGEPPTHQPSQSRPGAAKEVTTMAVAAWDPAHDLPPLAARTPAPSSPPEQVAGVDKKGAALGGFGGVEKPAPESPGPEQQPATPEDAEQWLDTRDRLAAVAEKLQEQQDQHQQQLKQLQQSQQQLPELPGQSFFGRMRDLVSRVPGFRWIGPSAFTLAAGAHARHQEQADAAQEQGAKLLQGQQLLADQQQKLAGAHERPGMAEAVEKVEQHREDLQAGASAWRVGRRQFSDQLAGACRDLRLAVSDLDAARKEQYDPTAPSGGAAYEALGGWQQLAREQLQELEQELQDLREAAEPTDQQALLALQHGFQPTDQQAELLQAGLDLARDAQQVPGQIKQEQLAQQSARIDQQLQQRADQQQSQTQRSSSGPRMG
mgnify:CR=1 FL=1